MFDPGIVSEPSAEKQRETVRGVVRTQIENHTFTYTELLSSKEPMRSFALEALDGVKVEGTRPMYGVGTIEDWDGERILLVHIDPKKTIRHPVTEDQRIAGTNQSRPMEVMKDFGNIAEILDAPGKRIVRNILFQQGWPSRQNTSNGSHEGSVVEWRWLEKEAALGDKAAHGVLEMYESMKPRVEAFFADKAKKADAARDQKTKAKTAAQGQLGA